MWSRTLGNLQAGEAGSWAWAGRQRCEGRLQALGVPALRALFPTYHEEVRKVEALAGAGRQRMHRSQARKVGAASQDLHAAVLLWVPVG